MRLISTGGSKHKLRNAGNTISKGINTRNRISHTKKARPLLDEPCRFVVVLFVILGSRGWYCTFESLHHMPQVFRGDVDVLHRLFDTGVSHKLLDVLHSDEPPVFGPVRMLV